MTGTAVWMLQCTEKCSRSCGTEHYKNSLTHFEGLHVLLVFWYCTFFHENPPRPMRTKLRCWCCPVRPLGCSTRLLVAH